MIKLVKMLRMKYNQTFINKIIPLHCPNKGRVGKHRRRIFVKNMWSFLKKYS